MGKVRREWLRLDANFYMDPRIVELPPQAELLYLRGLAYAKANDTDGVLSASSLRAISVRLREPSTLANVLVTFGLWEATGNGWRVPRDRWEKWQTARTAETPASRARVRADASRARTSRVRPDQTRRDVSTSLKVPPATNGGSADDG